MEARDLRPHLLVAGSGKTGRDCGLFFLGRGWRVTWLSRSRERRDELTRRIARELQRLESDTPGRSFKGVTKVCLFAPATDLRALAPDLFLEAVEEDVAQKRAVFRRLRPQLAPGTPLATNSSSILPGEIAPSCLGSHFFFPLALTRLVEAILPPDADGRCAPELLRHLRSAGLRVIVQSPANAFAVNRLLLPLQARAVRALLDGWPAPVVDAASATPLMPIGQLALMDAVGLDTIAAAVDNYLRRMRAGEAQEYAEMLRTLRGLLAAGKRGRKNRDGFLTGSPLPWEARERTREDAAALALDFSRLAGSACVRALERGDIAPDDLALALSSLFGAEVPLPLGEVSS